MDERIRETSFLNGGLEITLADEVSGKEKVSHKYEGGIAEFVQHLGERAVSIHPEVIRLIGSREDSDGKLVEADIALLWSDAYSEKIQCYTNIIRNRDGGTHMSGLRGSLTRTINTYGNSRELLKKVGNLSGEDIREGLTAVISIKHTDPSFS